MKFINSLPARSPSHTARAALRKSVISRIKQVPTCQVVGFRCLKVRQLQLADPNIGGVQCQLALHCQVVAGIAAYTLFCSIMLPRGVASRPVEEGFGSCDGVRKWKGAAHLNPD
jgi:hypothetical protein